MRAVIIKDWQWLLLFMLGGCFTFVLMAGEIGYDSTFVFPDTRYVRFFLPVWWPLALGLGICAAISDEVQGTLDYLRHRPLTLFRIHSTKVLACCFIISSWLVLPLLLLALFGTRTYTADYFGLGLDKVLHGTLMFAFFAIAYFSGNWLARLLIAVALTVPLALFNDAQFSYWQHPAPDPWAVAAMHIVLALALLHGSWLSIKSGRDPDLPLPDRALWPAAIAALAFVWGGDMVLRECVQWQRGMLRYPRLAKTEAGEYRLTTSVWNPGKSKREYFFVDAEHRVVGEASDFKQINVEDKSSRR